MGKFKYYIKVEQRHSKFAKYCGKKEDSFYRRYNNNRLHSYSYMRREFNYVMDNDDTHIFVEASGLFLFDFTAYSKASDIFNKSYGVNEISKFIR